MHLPPFNEIPLPDGGFIPDWRRPTEFTKTYIVDQAHPEASDKNPGTEIRPLATINKAAGLVKAGEQVLVKNGLYREWVRPGSGGSGPGCMIRFAAFPGCRPVIRASNVIRERWESTGGESNSTRIWKTALPNTFFKEWSPLTAQNLGDEQYYGMTASHFEYFRERFRGKEPYTLRRALLFVNGVRVEQTTAVPPPGGGDPVFAVEEDGRTLHLALPASIDPNSSEIEISAFPHCFAPALPGIHFVEVSGFTMEHAGNGFAYPMIGALSPNFGHHWIIEGNTVRDCNGAAIDVGVQMNRPGDFYYPGGGGYIIRGNTVENCGFAGFLGAHVENTVLEFNTISGCCWHDTELLYENGGVKFLYNRNVLVRGNHIHHIRKACGVWLDWACENCRVTGNVIHDMTSMFGGIFMEASRVPNLVDNNICCDIDGNGIYQHDCDNLVIAHNSLFNCTGFGVRMWRCEGREVLGRPTECVENLVAGNLCASVKAAVGSLRHRNRFQNNFLAGQPVATEETPPDALPLYPKSNEVPLFPVIGDKEPNTELSEENPDGVFGEQTDASLRLELDKEDLRLVCEGVLSKIDGEPFCAVDIFNRPRRQHSTPGILDSMPEGGAVKLIAGTAACSA